MTVLDQEMIANVLRPIEAANGLPNAFYTDPDVFEAEKRVLFASTWACMGFAKDVPNKGDANPVTFLGQPLLVVRGEDGVDWIPYRVADETGIGRQLTVAEINGDNLPDIVVGGMKGAHVLLHEREDVSADEWRKAQPQLTKET